MFIFSLPLFFLFLGVASHPWRSEHDPRVLHLPHLHLQAFHLEDDAEETPEPGSSRRPDLGLFPGKMFRNRNRNRTSEFGVQWSHSVERTKCWKCREFQFCRVAVDGKPNVIDENYICVMIVQTKADLKIIYLFNNNLVDYNIGCERQLFCQKYT